MAEMTMISMAVLTATQKSRSFLEAAAGRKDLYLEESPLEEETLEIGTLGIGTLEKADVIYLPDYSSLDFRQVRELLKAGKHVLFGTMGAADAGSLKALAQTADEHGAVLLDHIHLAFNPCMASLKTALTCLGPIGRIRLHSCEYAFCCEGLRISPVRPPPAFRREAHCFRGAPTASIPLCISSAYRNRWMPRWCSRNMEWTQPALSGDIWAPPGWR